MPYSDTITFMRFVEHYVFQGNVFHGMNYSLQQPPSVSPSFGESSPFIYRWTRTVVITLDIESKYDFSYAKAFSGYDHANCVATVEETWNKTSGNPWTATYTNSVPLDNLIEGELGNNDGIGNALIRFSCSVDGTNGINPIGDGPKSMDVDSVEVFGEAVTFFAHSYSSLGYELSAGSTLHARIPGFAADFAGSTNYWRPTTKFRVKYKPVDLDGNYVSKDVLLYFGEVSKLGSVPGAEDIGPADDVTEYLREVTTPVDGLYTFTGRGVLYGRQIDRPGLPFFVLDTGGDAVQCEATKLRIHWRYSNFGLSPGSYPFEEVVFPVDFPVNHLFVADADCTDVVAATLELPVDKPLNTGAWSAAGAGSSVAGDQLTAGATVCEFTSVLSPQPNGSPYRYLAFDYNVISGSPSIEIEAVGSDFGSIGASKVFRPGILNGTGTLYVDTLRPREVDGVLASSMARLEAFNQCNANPNTAAIDRFDGLNLLHSIILKFADAVVEVANLRMSVKDEASLSHRIGRADGQTGEAQHQMAGHVDGRDAFRIDRSNITNLVSGLNLIQSLDIDSTNYPRPSHSPVSTLSTVSTSNLAVQTAGLGLQPDQDLLGGAEIRVSVGSTGGIAFFYGLEALGWFDEATAIGAWGNEVAATAVPSQNPVSVKIVSPGDPTFDIDYLTNLIGFGRESVPYTRYLDPASPVEDVEHYVPLHPAPQAKRTYDLRANGRRYHIYVGAATRGSATISYCVSSALRHFRAYIVDGSIITGVNDNALDPEAWNDTDSGIEADSVCIVVEKRAKAPLLFLYVGTTEGEIYRYQSPNEGQTWEMATQISFTGTAKIPAVVIGANGNHYVYWIDDEEAVGRIFDASLAEVQALFTAVSPVDESGLAAAESPKQGGVQRIGLFVIQSGDLFLYQGESGRSFS